MCISLIYHVWFIYVRFTHVLVSLIYHIIYNDIIVCVSFIYNAWFVNVGFIQYHVWAIYVRFILYRVWVINVSFIPFSCNYGFSFYHISHVNIHVSVNVFTVVYHLTCILYLFVFQLSCEHHLYMIFLYEYSFLSGWNCCKRQIGWECVHTISSNQQVLLQQW